MLQIANCVWNMQSFNFPIHPAFRHSEEKIASLQNLSFEIDHSLSGQI